jgi:hypothetical protein
VVRALHAEALDLGHPISALQCLREELEASELPLHHEYHQRILLQSNRIYRHSTIHVNYTTYDLRREQDIINPTTSRRDVMCLARSRRDPEAHHHVYARVLGIYHVNVAYRGPGSFDTAPCRFDFLWVRWYESVGPGDPLKLQRLMHPSLDSSAESVDFLDPSDVLRACHIIPRFHKGLRYESGNIMAQGALRGTGSLSDDDEPSPPNKKITRCSHMICQPLHSAITDCKLSRCAQEEDDWHEYYVNRYLTNIFLIVVLADHITFNTRFVDRDMLMRFHWGLGVGHVYSHEDAPASLRITLPAVREARPNLTIKLPAARNIGSGAKGDLETGADIESSSPDDGSPISVSRGAGSDSEDSELTLSDK